MGYESRALVLSLDYELFFGRSGTVEKCLFDPCDALLAAARSMGVQITFFVDAGMILCMQRNAASQRSVAKLATQVRKHVASLASSGHEIALHVHPHWEDTGWRDGTWDFSGTRYRLDEFTDNEIAEILSTYSICLAELSGNPPIAYRAGGFCAEPFHRLIPGLTDAGIMIDSSVVPGASLIDADKGFDFRHAPDAEWWCFDVSPGRPQPDGQFLEVPVTPHRLPATYYWKRLVNKIRREPAAAVYGDGTWKNIGGREAVRRLGGLGRAAEMSIDEPKVCHISADKCHESPRRLWHLMGHPKLLSDRSIDIFKVFVEDMNFEWRDSIRSAAELVRSGQLGSGDALQ